MPPVLPDYQEKSAVRRYAGFAWNGLAVPACGCVFGAVYHALAGLWEGFQNWRTKTWAMAKVDFHTALEELRK